jgi:hypothetical protein
VKMRIQELSALFQSGKAGLGSDCEYRSSN